MSIPCAFVPAGNSEIFRGRFQHFTQEYVVAGLGGAEDVAGEAGFVANTEPGSALYTSPSFGQPVRWNVVVFGREVLQRIASGLPFADESEILAGKQWSILKILVRWTVPGRGVENVLMDIGSGVDIITPPTTMTSVFVMVPDLNDDVTVPGDYDQLIYNTSVTASMIPMLVEANRSYYTARFTQSVFVGSFVGFIDVELRPEMRQLQIFVNGTAAADAQWITRNPQSPTTSTILGRVALAGLVQSTLVEAPQTATHIRIIDSGAGTIYTVVQVLMR
jgi:hypothetical protein